MARKTFLYYMFNRDKLPMYEADNGFVQTGNENMQKPDGQPADIKFAPEQWLDTQAKYARNIKYWGIFRDLISNLKFPKDGKKILKKLATESGITAICYLGITKLNRLVLPYNYEPWLLTELNFLKYKESKSWATIEALEGGLSKILKAQATNKIEIDIDSDPEMVKVKMDGVSLVAQANYVPTNGFSETGDIFFEYRNHFVSLQETLIDGASRLAFKEVARSKFIGNTEDLNTDGQLNPNWFFEGTVDGTMEIEWRLKIGATLVPNTPFNSFGDSITAVQVLNNGVPDATRQVTMFQGKYKAAGDVITGTATVAIKPGDKFYFRTFYTVIGSVGDAIIKYVYYEPGLSYFRVKARYKHPTTYINGLYIGTVLKRLVESMIKDQVLLGEQPFYRSDFLENKKDLVITSGDALRQIAGAKIKTSWDDMFKSVNHWCVGLGVENNKYRLELIKHFFSDEVIMDLGEVKDAEWFFAEDLFYNKILTGGPEIEYGDLNGKYEPNQGQEWISPLTRAEGELDLKTPWRRDPYGIEIMRINLSNKKTTDDASDNDVFMLHTDTVEKFFDGFDFTGQNPQPSFYYYDLKRPAYSLVEGLPPDSDAFNLELSPKKTILNNAPLIASIHDLQESSKIRFGSAEKNKELRTILAGVDVDEDKDIQIGSLQGKLFKPVYFTFNTEVPVNLLTLMDANPYGKIKFQVNGRNYFGYMCDGSIRPGDNDAQNWKLICCIENDLSKFYEPL